ncbi:MAG: fumarate reductase (quinol) flavoprotein subunit [Acidobacteria bacterium]|nr:fumarate reductase (quinol) flavoprotein subunit [Acidobacteriota bacterium]
MESHEYDIVIVGGGGAGLRAAIELGESFPKLRIAVVSKVYPMRSHTVAAEGGAAAVIKSNDSLENHCHDTVSGSDWLGDQDVIETFVKEAPDELIRMEHWGCPWSREPNGQVAVRPFGGMVIERTWFAADKTGFHMLHTLYQTALKFQSLKWYDEWFVTKLLVDNGRCQGVAAIELLTGQLHAILGKAVILCTGGAGRMFPFTTNGAIKTGDGMFLAYQAGVALKDMEFVQYHPTGLPGSGILITEAARGEGGILTNKDGYRYLQDYGLGPPEPFRKRAMELGPRDRLSQAFVQEEAKGRTISTPFGSVVHLDLRHLGEATINKKLPFVRELSKNYAGIDPVYEPIPVRPVIHYIMGGVDTDVEGATVVPGLYAAGECACISLNGANRLGSNSLTELLVFGRRAAHAAAQFAAENPALASEKLKAQASDEQERIASQFIRKQGGNERVATLRLELNRIMEAGAGIYRSGDGLQKACSGIAALKDRFRNVALDDRSLSYNTELISVLELEFLLDIGQSLLHSALCRTESRGSHQRTDHTARDDQKFLKHSMAYRTDAEPRIEYKDVVITRWPPKERVYGK